MRFRLTKSTLAAGALGALLALAVFMPNVVAEGDGAVLWVEKAQVKRVEKPNKKRPRPVPKVEQTTLLTFQWRLLKRGDGNLQREVDPSQVFETGDQVKLAVTTNQNGYLYVINRLSSGEGRLVFPDPRSNNGLNEVKKNQEYIVPSFCPIYPNPNDCWWQMEPPAGRETLIVVFSRDEYDKLPSRAELVDGEYEYPVVERDFIGDLMNSFFKQKKKEVKGRLPIPGKPTARFATRLQNSNVEDNEELIARIELKHGD
jgi:hypothetical protein